jgi:hypothetical protein
MSAAYTKGVSDNRADDRMVHGKFHIIQNVMEACDQVRKADSRTDGRKRDRLMGARWIWLKNRVNCTEKETQKRESMVLERCVTGMACEMSLSLYGNYERKDAEKAGKLLREWCDWVHAMQGQSGELLEPIFRVVRIVEGYLEGIMATGLEVCGPLS